LYERKNELIRPYIANVDAVAAVVAPVPEPDWICVEKIILNCLKQNVTPFIILNKADLIDEETKKKMLAPYENSFDVFAVSAKTGEGIKELEEYMEGKLVCLAGQSAVGKSSLINAVFSASLEVGELSKKIARGKNTTRHVEIYDFGNCRIADTCGFSVAEHADVMPEELTMYYGEFTEYRNFCRYDNCTHISEPDCAVKRAVNEGKLNKDRYERYVSLYNEIKESRKKRYA